MPTFTVKSASKKKDVEGKHGPMQVIALTFDDGTQAEWFTKASTEIPAAGSSIEGDLEDGPYGKKFKKAFSGGGGAPRRRDPAETARIERMAAHKTAAAICGPVEPNAKTFDNYLRDFKTITDWLIADLPGSAQTPSQPTSAPPNGKPEEATSNQKRALTTALNRLGIDNPWQAKIVHAVAGNPPSKSGISQLLDVVLNESHSERAKIDKLQAVSGVTIAGGDAPADTSDLDPEAVPF